MSRNDLSLALASNRAHRSGFAARMRKGMAGRIATVPTDVVTSCLPLPSCGRRTERKDPPMPIAVLRADLDRGVVLEISKFAFYIFCEGEAPLRANLVLVVTNKSAAESARGLRIGA
jgi:hypothetical protein